MEGLPPFWRTEIWHPLSVHFPIALLLVATLFKLGGLRTRRGVLNRSGSLLLGFGVLAAWLAVYTGDLADGAVSRTLCDPTVLKSHENAAYITAWVFSAAWLLDRLNALRLFTRWRVLASLVVLLMAVGAGYLSYVGHLGAELVYQQAAGVHCPSGDCQEFSE